MKLTKLTHCSTTPTEFYKTGNPPKSQNLESVEKLFNILFIYFWIHGLGLPIERESEFKYKLLKFLSVAVSLLFEASNILFFIIKFKDSDISNTKNLVNAAVALTYFSLSLIQRYYLFSRRQKLKNVIDELADMSSRIKLTSKLLRKLIFLLVITDAILILTVYTSVTVEISPLCEEQKLSVVEQTKPNKTLVEGLTLSEGSCQSYIQWLPIIMFIVIWKNTAMNVTIFFNLMCSVLANILLGLKALFSSATQNDEALIEIYNEFLDIMRAVIDIFSDMLLCTSIASLSFTFFHAYYILFTGSLAFYETASRILRLTICVSTFVSMCIFASYAQNADVNVRLAIEVKNQDFSKKLRSKFKGFRLLDSILIDKSLILSAVGVLLTYGVMTATFNASSK